MAYCDGRERILAVEQILKSSKKPMTIAMIVDKLKNDYDIKVDRKAVMRDISALTMFFDIRSAGPKIGYYIAHPS